ncbi:MAG: hypothetical protein LIQ31_11275, partial [Planctomycetes bacterium]|nr:hypothetical protein [Planctomycetota bacterium]
MTHSRSWFQPCVMAGCLALAGLIALAGAVRAEDCVDCPPPDSGPVVVNEYVFQKDPDTFVDVIPSQPGPGTLPFAITPDEPAPVIQARRPAVAPTPATVGEAVVVRPAETAPAGAGVRRAGAAVGGETGGVLDDTPVADEIVVVPQEEEVVITDGPVVTYQSETGFPEVVTDADGVVAVPAPLTVADEAVVVVPARPNGAVSPFLLDVPTLSELRKPIEETPVIEDAPPEAPGPVLPEQRRTDLAACFPDDPFWYAEVADAEQARRQWAASPPGRLLAEPALEQTFRNNRFGLGLLFSDLPASVIDAARIASIATAFDLAEPLAAGAHSIAGAAYLGDDGVFRFLFLMDIGLDREPAFDIMSRWETTFHLAYPGSTVVRGNRRERQYLDVITVRGSSRMNPAEVALGFIANLAVSSNDPRLAR